MQNSMTGRPRPVTATVTKPKWMQIPNPDAMAKIRSRSLESTGSTDSLTSLLDHDSYVSEGEWERTEEIEDTNSMKLKDVVNDIKRNMNTTITKQRASSGDVNLRTPSPSKPRISNKNLSAWEQWVIQKAKDDRRKRLEEKQKKSEDKIQQEKQEQEKQLKLKKAEIVRQQWIETKEKETEIQRKTEKSKIRDDKRKKEAIELDIKRKSEQKYAMWMNLKKKEENESRRMVKQENRKNKQHKENRKHMSEQKFQEWLKLAHTRPKTAPNSFGYLAGKITGYHDRSAYPQPAFYNPIPWHPPALPSSQKAEKTPRSKSKPYKWNPEKYF